MVKKVVLSDQDSDGDQSDDLPQVLTKAEASARFNAQKINFKDKTERVVKREKQERPAKVVNDLFSQNLDVGALQEIQNRKKTAES